MSLRLVLVLLPLLCLMNVLALAVDVVVQVVIMLIVALDHFDCLIALFLSVLLTGFNRLCCVVVLVNVVLVVVV